MSSYNVLGGLPVEKKLWKTIRNVLYVRIDGNPPMAKFKLICSMGDVTSVCSIWVVSIIDISS